jgi:hypothetical protein
VELEFRTNSSTVHPIEPVTVGGGADDGDSQPPIDDTNVTVSYGIHQGRYPVGGMTVSEARQALARLINIDPSAVAVINGAPVDENLRIAGNVTMLSFVKPSAMKGSNY